MGVVINYSFNTEKIVNCNVKKKFNCYVKYYNLLQVYILRDNKCKVETFIMN